MRVVGALYGVTLTVSAPEAGERASVAKKPSAQRARMPARTTTATDTTSPVVKGARSRSANKNVRARKATPPASAEVGSPNNAEVRSWARQSGLTISDRGRIPASVMTAYRDTHAV